MYAYEPYSVCTIYPLYVLFIPLHILRRQRNMSKAISGLTAI